jgi:hypothetical protein
VSTTSSNKGARRVRRAFVASAARRRPAGIAVALVSALAASVVPFAALPALGAVAGTSLRPMCQATNPSVTDPAAIGEGRRVSDVLIVGDTVYLAGKFTALIPAGSSVPVPRNRLGACSLTTGQVLPWDPAADDGVWSLATDGTAIYAGGSFKNVGGVPRMGLAAIDPYSGSVLPWAPAVTAGSVRALALSGGTLWAGGTFKFVNGQPRNALAAVNTSDGSLRSWNPGSRYDAAQLYEVRSLVHWQSKVVVGEWLDNSMNNLFAVHDTTGEKLSWKTTPSQSESVYQVAALGSRLYAAVGGGGGHIQSYDLGTGVRKWDIKGDGDAQAVWASGDIVYAGGHFEQLDTGGAVPKPVNRAVAVTADDSGTLLDWNPGVDHVGQGVYAVEGGAGALLLGGEFTNIASRPQQGVGRFTADYAGPTVTSVSPATLRPGAPQTVTITGSGFAAGSPTLSLGPGVDLASVSVVSPTTIQATATVQMAARPGSHAVLVTSNGLTGLCGGCVTVSGSSGPVIGSGPGSGGAPAAGPGGYRLVAQDGGIFAFGDANFYGSTGDIALVQPIVGMTSTPSGQGYWLTAADGGIFAFGDATFHGSTGDIKLAKPIVGMSATPSGRGYRLVASDGGIFAFGDATFHGSTGDLALAQPIVGMTTTPDGKGYWLLAADGGIFAFGSALFQGSTGDLKLARPIIGMTATKSGQGYWLVASDGGIFAFGDAVFRGSTGDLQLAQPIVGIASTSSGNGYWMVASDGGIFAFGDALFKGSTGDIKLVQPIVGMART